MTASLEAVLDRVAGGLHGSPAVTLAWAQSLDGCLTTEPGRGCQISNASSQRVTHRLRALHDAILVGVNTVLVDDPRLTVRLAEGPDPTPVVLDSHLRTPVAARVLRGSSTTAILATSEAACPSREAALREAGALVWRVPTVDGGVDLARVLERLADRGVRSLMIEGGARVITSVLRQRLAHQVVLTISPRFLGGVRAVQAPTCAGLADVLCHNLDGDLLVHGKLR